MTAYQGVRPMPLRPSITVGGRRPASAVGPRRRLASPARAGRRAHPAGRLLAVVLLGFLVGLIYLSQTLHLAATNYQYDELLAERDDLARQVRTLETSLLRWGAEPMVVERAQQLGFETLIGRVRLAGR